MATRKVATVFGASGFLGRYVVRQLAQADYVIRAAVRDTEGALFLRTMGVVGQIVPLRAPVTDEAGVARAVQHADVVINLVGILAERRPGDFQRIQADGAGRVARLSAAAGVGRLVHISAIGADPASRSQYGRTKGEGEQAVLAAFPEATILRPSIVFGPEDQFFNRFAAMAQNLPVLPIISGETRFQPVYVGDVAAAVMSALRQGGARYELGGPQVLTFRELMAWLLDAIQRHRRIVEIPPRLAELQARILERLPGKLLTRDQLTLLAQDNIVAEGQPGLAELGIEPTPIDLIVPRYVGRFRPGGARSEVPVGPDRS